LKRAILIVLSFGSCPALAQGKFYVGLAGGVSTLSSDARSLVTPTSTSVSLYSPQNGPLLNAFAGVHLHDYISVQGNYLWNSNTLTLTSSTANTISSFYEQERSSTQQGIVGDFLLYFRDRRSWIRPYLSVGTGFIHLSSREKRTLALRGSPVLPSARFSSTNLVLRVAVGADVKLRGGWNFRYSFSETMGDNPISEQLSPPGSSSLKNFKNLFGIVRRF
jgi:Outer membrane protein beta-barrel domain